MKAFGTRLLLSGAIVATGLVGTATAAQAAPTGCVLTPDSRTDGASVQCSSGTGQVRVVVECTVFRPGDPISTLRFGPWVNVGQRSSQNCPGGPRLTDDFFEVR